MIFWEPKTVAEKKLLELYSVEEDEAEDHGQDRGHRDRRKEIPPKNLRRLRDV
jgi:hypothetical protein